MTKDSFTPSSSFLSRIEYDSVNHTLDTTFKNGTSTRHLYVFPVTFEAWKQAPSHGKFFATQIKGKFMSVALVKHTIGKREKTALKTAKQFHGLRSMKSKHPLTAGLTGILQSKGLIPKELHKQKGLK